MKKLIEKDKKIRINIKKIEIKKITLKSIFQNLNFFKLIRFNAFLKLNQLSQKSNNPTSLFNKCLYSHSKK